MDKYLQVLLLRTRRPMLHNPFGTALHLRDGNVVEGNASFSVETPRRSTTMMDTKREMVNTSLSLETFVNKLQLPYLVPMTELKNVHPVVKRLFRKNSKCSSGRKVETLHQSMENINKRSKHFVCNQGLSSAFDFTGSSRTHTVQSNNEFNPEKISRYGSRRNVEERSHYFMYSPNGRVHQQFVFSGQKRWWSSSSHKPETSQSICTLSTLQNGGFALPEVSVARGGLHVQTGFKRCLLFSPIAQRFQEADTLSLVRESLRIPVSMFWARACTKIFYQNSEGTHSITQQVKHQSNYISGRHDNDGIFNRSIVNSQRHSNIPPATLGFHYKFKEISASSNSRDGILRFDNRFCGDDPIFYKTKIAQNNVVVFTDIQRSQSVDFRINKVDRSDVLHSSSSFACTNSISLFTTTANTVIAEQQQQLLPINSVKQQLQGRTVMVDQQLEDCQMAGALCNLNHK